MKYSQLALIIGITVLLLSSACSETEPNKEVQTPKDEITELTDEIREQPNNPNLYVKRALEYRDRKLFDLALQDVDRALSVDSTVAYFHQVKGEVYFASRALGPARLALEKSLRFDPDDNSTLLKLAEVEFLLRRYTEALTHINDALRNDDKQAQGYFLKGFIYKELGDTAIAISSFQTATEVNPDHYEAYMELATLAAYQGSELALQYYDNAIGIKPKSAEAIYGKGYFEQQRGNFDEALAIYRQLTSVDKQNFLGYYNTGYIYLTEFAEFDSANAYFDTVLMVQPNMIDALYNKGLASEYKKDLPKARDIYRAVLDADPQHDLAARGLDRLN